MNEDMGTFLLWINASVFMAGCTTALHPAMNQRRAGSLVYPGFASPGFALDAKEPASCDRSRGGSLTGRWHRSVKLGRP
jgi:hypothetical protein